MITTHTLYCCGCAKDITARLTTGKEVHPHRKDLHGLPFWVCDGCRNHVGCHHKYNNKTTPLGHIPTAEIKYARLLIHREIDPIWQTEKMTRKEVYLKITEKIGWRYHTAKIKTIAEAREVFRIVQGIARALDD